MRDIKFRAWDRKYKKMHYKVCIGNTDENDDNYTAHSVYLHPGDTDYRIDPPGRWMNFDEHSDYVIMQYIGLKDKNGKEIYKSDVVLWDGRKAVIEWLPRMAGYYAMWKGEGVHFHDMQEILPSHGGLRHIEVIGNIHENPELLNPQQGNAALNTMLQDPNIKQDQESAPATTDTQEATTESAEEATTEG